MKSKNSFVFKVLILIISIFSFLTISAKTLVNTEANVVLKTNSQNEKENTRFFIKEDGIKDYEIDNSEAVVTESQRYQIINDTQSTNQYLKIYNYRIGLDSEDNNYFYYKIELNNDFYVKPYDWTQKSTNTKAGALVHHKLNSAILKKVIKKQKDYLKNLKFRESTTKEIVENTVLVKINKDTRANFEVTLEHILKTKLSGYQAYLDTLRNKVIELTSTWQNFNSQSHHPEIEIVNIKREIANLIAAITEHHTIIWGDFAKGNFTFKANLYNHIGDNKDTHRYYWFKASGWYHSKNNYFKNLSIKKRIKYIYRKNRIIRDKYHSEVPQKVRDYFKVELFPKIYFATNNTDKETLYVNDREISVLNDIFIYDLEENANAEKEKVITIYNRHKELIYQKKFSKITNSGLLKYRLWGWNPDINLEQRNLITPFLGELKKEPNPLYDPLVNPLSGLKSKIMWANFEGLKHKPDFIKYNGNNVLEAGAFLEVIKTHKGVVFQISQNTNYFSIKKLDLATKSWQLIEDLFSAADLSKLKEDNNLHFSYEGVYLFTISSGVNQIQRYYLFQIGSEAFDLDNELKLVPWKISPYGLILQELDKKLKLEKIDSNFNYSQLIDFWLNTLLAYINNKEKHENDLFWEMTYSHEELENALQQGRLERVLMPSNYGEEAWDFIKNDEFKTFLNVDQDYDQQHLFFSYGDYKPNIEYHVPKISWNDIRDHIATAKHNWPKGHNRDFSKFLDDQSQPLFYLYATRLSEVDFGLNVILKTLDFKLHPFYYYRRLYIDPDYAPVSLEALKDFQVLETQEINLQGATSEHEIRELLFAKIEAQLLANEIPFKLIDVNFSHEDLKKWTQVATNQDIINNYEYHFLLQNDNQNVLVPFRLINHLDKDVFVDNIDLSQISKLDFTISANSEQAIIQEIKAQLSAYLKEHNLVYGYDLVIKDFDQISLQSQKDGNFSVQFTLQNLSNNLDHRLEVGFNNKLQNENYLFDFAALKISDLYFEINNHQDLISAIIEKVSETLAKKQLYYLQDYEILDLFDVDKINQLLKMSTTKYNHQVFTLVALNNSGFNNLKINVYNKNKSEVKALVQEIDNPTRDFIEEKFIETKKEAKKYNFLAYTIPLVILATFLLALFIKYLYHRFNKKVS